MKDYLIKAYAYDGTVRVYVARTTQMIAHAQKVHDLWPTSAAALGRLLTASVIMGAMYKGALNHDDHELTIRYATNGPLEGMVATTNAKGEVRGYVGNPHVFLQYNDGKLNVAQAVGQGQLHVTKDLKVRNIFTSSVDIQTGEVAEDFAYYFTASEQIPSAVSLGVKVNDDHTILHAGGFIIQMMPGYQKETVTTIETILKDLPPISVLLDQGNTPEMIAAKLTQDNYQLLETMDLHYRCDCHKEKFERGIISLGPVELKRLLEEDNMIETVCHFCLETYHFDANDIQKLIKESEKNRDN